MAPSPKSDPQQQNACGYAIQMANGFITLAAAGVAFVVGLVFSEKAPAADPLLLRCALVLFGTSTLLGWLFVMRMTGKIAGRNDYTIYKDFAQAASLFQILLFAAGICLLGILLWRKTARADPGMMNQPNGVALRAKCDLQRSGSLRTAHPSSLSKQSYTSPT
jgi:hypothetical protein